MFLLPVIPFVTDTPELMEQALAVAKEAGLDFIIFGVMMEILDTGTSRLYKQLVFGQ